MVYHPPGIVVAIVGTKMLCWGAQRMPYFECAIFFLLIFLIPTLPQYVDRVFFVPYAENPPRRIQTVTSGNISWCLNTGLYGIIIHDMNNLISMYLLKKTTDLPYVHTYLRMYICTYLLTYVLTYVCTYVLNHIKYKHMQVHTYIHMYVSTYKYVCTYQVGTYIKKGTTGGIEIWGRQQKKSINI